VRVASDTLAGAAPDGRPVPEATADVVAALEATLAEFLSTQTAALARLDPALEPIATAVRQAVLTGGERLSPTFAFWGWRGAVGPDPPVQEVLPALAALELLRAFALVQDEAMSGSTARSGRLTAHRTLAAEHAARALRGDAARFGGAAAMLVGDLCLAWADMMLESARLPSGTREPVRHCYGQMRVEMIAGQFLGLLGESAPRWSVVRALRAARLKTASHTVILPLHYGAALGNASADDPLTGAYARYGRAVGEAFQLRDDLLGLYGDPATGETFGEDLSLGKPTALLELARALATSGQAAEMDRLLRRRRRGDLARLVTLVRETGATTHLDRMISERVAEALSILANAPMSPQARHALADLAATAAWRGDPPGVAAVPDLVAVVGADAVRWPGR
jgi:geranylgeranyl diphosphate synthase type I